MKLKPTDLLRDQLCKTQRTLSVIRDRQRHQQIVENLIIQEVSNVTAIVDQISHRIECIVKKYDNITEQNIKDIGLHMIDKYKQYIHPDNTWGYIMHMISHVDTNLLKRHRTIRQSIVDMKFMGIDVSRTSEVIKLLHDKGVVTDNSHTDYSTYVILAAIISFVYNTYVIVSDSK